MMLSDEEKELIEAIRNVQDAYPNGYESLELYSRELYENLVIIKFK